MSDSDAWLRAAIDALGQTTPEHPPNWRFAYIETARSRLARRDGSLAAKMSASALGRIVPEPEDISIGTGRHLYLAVMFLDICGFSNWPSSNHSEQLNVLTRLNVFMAEMLSIVRDHDGNFEKNTGDGLMAYFGGTASAMSDSAKTAVHCAAIMHGVNDYVLTPWFEKKGLTPVQFRVGIDCGEMTIARVGIHNLAEQNVAIGSHANIACKIMRFAPNGGTCIGNNVFNGLSSAWRSHAKETAETGFFYTKDWSSYKAYKLEYKLPVPTFL